MKGLYIHIPFCAKKCPYCDFYSLAYSKNLSDNFTQEVLNRLKNMNETYETLYFGGGTPSLLGMQRIENIIQSVNLSKNAEITLECNPNTNFLNWKNTSINRLSLGLQSINQDELNTLGRSHNKPQVIRTVESAREIGIENISADLMISLPDMDEYSLLKSVEFCAEQNFQHISSYMLKVEEGTQFHTDNFKILDEDKSAKQYLLLVDYLKSYGYNQYEISNFSKEGFESKHNLKYWLCQEYSALGPSAHSYENGERRYFPRDIDYFLQGKDSILDSKPDYIEELIMLKLRLTQGLCQEDVGEEIFKNLLKKTKMIPKDLIEVSRTKINLTSKGFLLSNAIILKLLD